jgi:hypothetical protein
VIGRAADRFHTGFDGIETWHCFSAGAHYDPDNVAYGPVVGVDEHVIAPGAGFEWHGHRGVTIVSHVVSGRLRHDDDRGRARVVGPGELLVQRAGSGIRHCEVNASAREPLRLVQTTLIAPDTDARVEVTTPPVVLDGVRFEVRTHGGTVDAPRWHLFVARGEWQLDATTLAPGDSVRAGGPAAITGSGELLVVVVSNG